MDRGYYSTDLRRASVCSYTNPHLTLQLYHRGVVVDRSDARSATVVRLHPHRTCPGVVYRYRSPVPVYFVISLSFSYYVLRSTII